MKKNILFLSTLFVLAGLVLAACGGTPTAYDRPPLHLPMEFFELEGNLKFSGYLPMGKVYDNGRIFAYIVGFTDSTVTIYICHKENVMLYGPKIACAVKIYDIDPNGNSYELWIGFSQKPFFIQVNGMYHGEPNVEIFNLDGEKYLYDRSGEATIAALLAPGIAQGDEVQEKLIAALQSNPEIGILSSAFQDLHYYVIGRDPEYHIAQYVESIDSFYILKWDAVEENFTYGETIAWSHNLTVYDRLDETQIVADQYYTVCSLPGDMAWIEDGDPNTPNDVLKGCFIGQFQRITDYPEPLGYKFITLDGKPLWILNWTSAFLLMRPVATE